MQPDSQSASGGASSSVTPCASWRYPVSVPGRPIRWITLWTPPMVAPMRDFNLQGTCAPCHGFQSARTSAAAVAAREGRTVRGCCVSQRDIQGFCRDLLPDFLLLDLVGDVSHRHLYMSGNNVTRSPMRRPRCSRSARADQSVPRRGGGLGQGGLIACEVSQRGYPGAGSRSTSCASAPRPMGTCDAALHGCRPSAQPATNGANSRIDGYLLSLRSWKDFGI